MERRHDGGLIEPRESRMLKTEDNEVDVVVERSVFASAYCEAVRYGRGTDTNRNNRPHLANITRPFGFCRYELTEPYSFPTLFTINIYLLCHDLSFRSALVDHQTHDGC